MTTAGANAKRPRSGGTLTWTSALVALLAAACGGDADEGPEPRFSVLQAEVFKPSCAFASCHGGDAPEQGLHLGTITAAMLINRPSVQAVGRLLVVPGDPEASYLLEKLTKVQPAAGNQMPPRGAGGALPAASIKAIRTWIANGAIAD